MTRRCRHPDHGRTWGIHLHHVVYQQHVRAAGGDVKDPRNLIPVCPHDHGRHHVREAPLPLSALTDENFEYARELLGAGAAHEYLRRYYTSEDPRLDDLLKEV